jgi:transcriptional regulator with XRE-family HTH domain
MSQQKSKDKSSTEFGTRLRLRMSRLGMQSNEVAEKLEVSESSISNWLSGVNSAKGANLRKLAELLSVSVPWLIGESDSEEQREELQSAYIYRPGEMDMREELNHWRHRAADAEKRLEELQKAIRSLVDLSAIPSRDDKRGAKGPSLAARVVAKAAEEFEKRRK